ncbi:hypothetical protein SCORR_v1c07890 [Spiroplasma corruscae]|uniref:Uncharacterized protein n=1 Tax=Spiroplasma corruscae TaxID=216934 RepID=A0A222EQB2_9MOLU|nr:hypothetical protein [Spiroplasma corruscae]ASP28561.1 hypothetical protein SCORR_v1c07890 [Spiroplasma corruscae]
MKRNWSKIIITIVTIFAFIYLINALFQLKINVLKIIYILEHFNNFIFIIAVVVLSSYLAFKFSLIVNIINKYKLKNFKNISINFLVKENLRFLRSYMLVLVPLILIRVCEIFNWCNKINNFDLFTSIIVLVSLFLILNMIIFSLFISLVFLCNYKKIKLLEYNIPNNIYYELLNFSNLESFDDYSKLNIIFQNSLLVSIQLYNFEKLIKVFLFFSDKLKIKKKGTMPPLLILILF